MNKTTEKDKESRIDIQAEVNDDTVINIEVQVRKADFDRKTSIAHARKENFL